MTPEQFDEKADMLLDLIDEVEAHIKRLESHAGTVYAAIHREHEAAEQFIKKERAFAERWMKKMEDTASNEFKVFHKNVFDRRLTIKLLALSAVVSVISGVVSGYVAIMILKHWQHIFF